MKLLALVLFISSNVMALEAVELASVADKASFFENAHGEVMVAESTSTKSQFLNDDSKECRAVIDSVYEDLENQADERCIGGKAKAKISIHESNDKKLLHQYGAFKKVVEITSNGNTHGCAMFYKSNGAEDIKTMASQGAFHCTQGARPVN